MNCRLLKPVWKPGNASDVCRCRGTETGRVAFRVFSPVLHLDCWSRFGKIVLRRSVFLLQAFKVYDLLTGILTFTAYVSLYCEEFKTREVFFFSGWDTDDGVCCALLRKLCIEMHLLESFCAETDTN